MIDWRSVRGCCRLLLDSRLNVVSLLVIEKRERACGKEKKGQGMNERIGINWPSWIPADAERVVRAFGCGSDTHQPTRAALAFCLSLVLHDEHRLLWMSLSLRSYL